MKVRLKEIKVIALNTGTVILLTQFVRLARVREGAELRMQQADIVHRVFQYAATSENPDLIVLFMRIKKSMSKHIQKSKLERPSFNLYDDAVA
ncbi:MAG: hypothetical protein JKX81_01420 [Arenicella sp.]|nr:hypothetical protein [Arenicella sp.]